jgi:hypothetical protein
MMAAHGGQVLVNDDFNSRPKQAAKKEINRRCIRGRLEITGIPWEIIRTAKQRPTAGVDETGHQHGNDQVFLDHRCTMYYFDLFHWLPNVQAWLNRLTYFRGKKSVTGFSYPLRIYRTNCQ